MRISTSFCYSSCSKEAGGSLSFFASESPDRSDPYKWLRSFGLLNYCTQKCYLSVKITFSAVRSVLYLLRKNVRSSSRSSFFYALASIYLQRLVWPLRQKQPKKQRLRQPRFLIVCSSITTLEVNGLIGQRCFGVREVKSLETMVVFRAIAASGLKNCAAMSFSASKRPPRSPRRSSKPQVYLFQIVISLLRLIAMLAYFILLSGFSKVGNLSQLLGYGALIPKWL